MRKLLAVQCIWALCLGHNLAAQQTVRGTITGADARPVSGALVVLADSAGREFARAVTNTDGRYRLVSPAGGSFHIRALRIGYRPTTTAVTIGPGRETVVDLTSAEPVLLQSVVVSAPAVCGQAAFGSDLLNAWEQARGGFALAELSAAAPKMVVQVVSYSQSLDSRGETVLENETAVRLDTVHNPWEALPPEHLTTYGYVSSEGEGMTFHAPGLPALASDAFLEEHCVAMVADSTGRRLGLRFHPTPARKDLPEIAGTIWLDRQSFELKEMQFRYVNLRERASEESAGGTISFDRMGNGGMIITRWELRLPIIAMEYTAASGIRSRARIAEPVLQGFRHVGGEVAMVETGGVTTWRAPGRSVSGIVIQSGSSQAIANAIVRVRGSSSVTRTDRTGTFSLDGVQPGEITLEIETDTLAALGTQVTVPLTLVGAIGNVLVRIPTGPELARRVCNATGRERPSVIVGRVTGTGSPVAHSAVIVEWLQPDGTKRPGRAGLSDAMGRFRICGAPTQRIVVRSESRWGNSAPVELDASVPVSLVELQVNPRNGANAALVGSVVTDADRVPLGGVEITVAELDRGVSSDSMGAFTLHTLPPGVYRLRARKIGFEAIEAPIELAKGDTARVSLIMNALPVLETVEVQAQRYLTDFEHHRKLGFGTFITRDQLDLARGKPLSSVLQQKSGLGVVQGKGNSAWVASRRGTRSMTRNTRMVDRADEQKGAPGGLCYSQVYIDRTMVYRAQPASPRNPPEPLFDINTIPPESIEAIEFYAGPAQTPAMYSNLNSECGVIVIHTRRTP